WPTFSGETQTPKPGNVHTDESRGTHLYWEIRLHLLHGCVAAFFHGPAHSTGPAIAPVLGAGRIFVPGRTGKDSSDGCDLQLSQERGLHFVSETSGYGSEGRALIERLRTKNRELRTE